MATAMRGVTRALQSMNRQMNMPQIARIMQEFEKQSDMMDMKEDMMNEVIDDAMGDEDEEEESDAIVKQVLDELGVQMNEQLSELPSTGGTLSTAAASKNTAVAAAAAAVSDADADLQARLDNLRRE